MSQYTLQSRALADLDVEAAYEWYENESSGLGSEFVKELRKAFRNIETGPLKYPELRSGIRRTVMHRFPYSIYFTIEGSFIIIQAVLHASRDPAEWQTRRG